jgi:enoyl-CoA hydratase
MAYTSFELAVEGAIAVIRLNRPDKLNSMIEAFWTEMVEVFDVIDQMAHVRAVVITSTGKHFSAGLDLAYAAQGLAPVSPDPGRARERFRRKIKRMQESFSVIDRCRVPVIAVVQGGCIGGAVDLITACDMRIGTQDAYITIQEINIGIVADVGTLQRLPHLLPQGLVRELAYTGRKMGAEEALRLGLFNSIHASQAEAETAAMALAADIAAKSPLAIAGIKQVLNAGRSQSVEEGLDYVATWNAGMLMSDDLGEAMGSVMQKRAARFNDLAD